MDHALGESPARRRFADLVSRPSVPLAEAALAIAEEEYPGLDTASYLRRLDELADRVAARLPGADDPAGALAVLRAALFEEDGFRGNAEEYYDPRNSFLNEVLDRRLGIPITLSVLAIEVACRVGVQLEGVGLPGHFLVRLASGERDLFVDPFHGGEILTAGDCAERFRGRTGGRSVEPTRLEAWTPRQILRRMLHNLEKIYVEAGDDVRAFWVVDRLVLLSPDDPSARRDRGLVEARLGGITAAAADLEAYLAAVPAARDAGPVRQLIAQLRARGAYLS